MPHRGRDVERHTADACEALARALGWDEAEVEEARMIALESEPSEVRLFLTLAARRLETIRAR